MIYDGSHASVEWILASFYSIIVGVITQWDFAGIKIVFMMN